MANETERILSLGASEIFEDLMYNVAYNEVLTRLKFSNTDDSILKEAVNSGLTIMFSSALMLYMQKQEAVIESIMKKATAFLLVILAPVRTYSKRFLGRFEKGRKLIRALRIFTDSNSDSIGYGNLVVTGINSAFNAQQSANQAINRANYSLHQKDHVIQKKDSNLAYAKAKADTFNQTLLFKLFASKFTAADKEIIRKMTGGSADIDIEKLNEIANFMWVTDSAGNITGLSEAFVQMLNGLGYFHNKVKKGK